MKTTRPPGSTRCSASAGSAAAVGGVDHRVPAQARQVVGGPRALDPDLPGEAGGLAEHVHLRAPGSGDEGGQQPDGSLAPRPGCGRRGTGPPRVRPAARWHPARPAHPASDPSRPARTRRHGYGQPLRQGPRPAVADADLVPVGAQMLAPALAPPAVPASEHGVAGDAPAQPGGVDARPGAGHRAAPLVPDPHRVRGLPAVQVRHVPRVELRVGADTPGPFDGHDHLARPGDRLRHLLDPGRVGPGATNARIGPSSCDRFRAWRDSRRAAAIRATMSSRVRVQAGVKRHERTRFRQRRMAGRAGARREVRRRAPARPVRQRPAARRAAHRPGRRPVRGLQQEPGHRRDAQRAGRPGRARRAAASAPRRCSPASTSTSPRTGPCCTPRCGCRATRTLVVDGQDVVADVHEVLDRMGAFADRVRSRRVDRRTPASGSGPWSTSASAAPTSAR